MSKTPVTSSVGKTHYYQAEPAEELKAPQEYKKESAIELAELTKRMEELKN